MLSIVIPVHNSEKYLRRCIDSIVNQTYRDIEIILVENNSTDSSANICEEYKIRDKRVKFFENIRKAQRQHVIAGYIMQRVNILHLWIAMII